MFTMRSRSRFDQLILPPSHISLIIIQDMTFDPTLQIYHFPCPCGDRFEINIDDLRDGEEIAVCPSCSLTIRVIFEANDLPKPEGGTQGGAQQVVAAAV